MCAHRYLDHPDGLVCTREDHADGGHVYAATTDDLGDHGRGSDETGDGQ